MTGADASPGTDRVVDIADETAVRQLFAEAGPFDVVINNAGILGREIPTEQLEIAEFDRVLHVNLRGSVLCSLEAVRSFVARKATGVILTNSSVAQHIPKPGFLPYSVSKGALENLMKTLALEYAPFGIRVNNVGPGAVLTNMNDAWRHTEEGRRTVEKHIPAGYAADPELIASVFAFLASDDARYITGQTIFVDGGLTLYPEFRENWSS